MTESKKNDVIIDLGDRKIQLPKISGTVGPDVVDIRKLYNDTNLFTFDPGFTSTASCESAITFIDGDKGALLYRGYSIEQLAQKSSYLEVCYLLLEQVYTVIRLLIQILNLNFKLK